MAAVQAAAAVLGLWAVYRILATRLERVAVLLISKARLKGVALADEEREVVMKLLMDSLPNMAVLAAAGRL